MSAPRNPATRRHAPGASMTRADIMLLIFAAIFAGSTLAVSTWHSARTLDVICARGLR